MKKITIQTKGKLSHQINSVIGCKADPTKYIQKVIWEYQNQYYVDYAIYDNFVQKCYADEISSAYSTLNDAIVFYNLIT